jgi:hypothetical protein
MILSSVLQSIKKYWVFALSFLILPVVVSANHGGATTEHLTLLGTDIKCTGADCGFDNLLILAAALVSFVVKLSIPVAAALFIYAGFLYVTATDDSSKVSKAKSIFTTAFWGFVIILGAWVIVFTLVNAIVDPEYLKGTDGNFFRFLNIN